MSEQVTERHMAAARAAFPHLNKPEEVGSLMFEAAQIAKHVPDYSAAVRKLRRACDNAVGLFNRGLLCGKSEGDDAAKHRDIGSKIMDELFAALEETKEFDA